MLNFFAFSYLFTYSGIFTFEGATGVQEQNKLCQVVMAWKLELLQSSALRMSWRENCKWCKFPNDACHGMEFVKMVSISGLRISELDFEV